MFDNLQITKAYKITDNIGGQEIEIATFNATLNKDSGIYQNMNINYPRLYEMHKDNILIAYREFNAEVSALAITMGLAVQFEGRSVLNDLEPVRQELKEIATGVMNEVIASLGNIEVNPVPGYEIGNYR